MVRLRLSYPEPPKRFGAPAALSAFMLTFIDKWHPFVATLTLDICQILFNF
jgi:hypothetical protein